jgi:hypothetical protein
MRINAIADRSQEKVVAELLCPVRAFLQPTMSGNEMAPAHCDIAKRQRRASGFRAAEPGSDRHVKENQDLRDGDAAAGTEDRRVRRSSVLLAVFGEMGRAGRLGGWMVGLVAVSFQLQRSGSSLDRSGRLE